MQQVHFHLDLGGMPPPAAIRIVVALVRELRDTAATEQTLVDVTKRMRAATARNESLTARVSAATEQT